MDKGKNMRDIQEEIERDIKNNRVILFMKGVKNMPLCGFSARVVDVLNQLGTSYETRDVLQDDLLREGIKTYSKWPTLPQLYIQGKFIGGCDIIMQLQETGKLQELIAD